MVATQVGRANKSRKVGFNRTSRRLALLAAVSAGLTGTSVHAGLVNPTLYATPSAFHDITQGNNGAFSAGPGWDACTGLGSPIGAAVEKALSAAVSGTPKTSDSPIGGKGGSGTPTGREPY